MAAPRIGIAFGSGSSRGWGHIGVARGLADAGINADVVAGTSIGALVGAAYAGDQLDILEEWVRSLGWRDVVGFLDVRLAGGGLIEGRELFTFLRGRHGNPRIEDLPRTFGTVATDLGAGREVWLRAGSVMAAVHASMAYPGLVRPVRAGRRWLVDGGLVNPVPVSLCRALGAEAVIAVDLNADVLVRHRRADRARRVAATRGAGSGLAGTIAETLGQAAGERLAGLIGAEERTPGFFDVVLGSIDIMQDRVTRSRMAGDPPDVVLRPRLGHLGFFDFDRGEEAISEGYAAVNRVLPEIKAALGV